MATFSGNFRVRDGSILSAAPRELRQAIEAVSIRRTLRGGEVLFNEGDPGDALFAVQQGEIEISVHAADGRKLTLDVMRGGEVFGEIALFGGDRTATARALGDCVLLAIRRADVLETLRRRPELALQFIDLLCARLRSLSDKLSERAFQPVPVRLASRLLYLDAKLARQGRVAVSQADLADFVGATREGVAKTLALWRSRNWVALSRGSIRILDRAALEGIGREFGE
jgi:CRP-like cAMP-binding protein